MAKRQYSDDEKAAALLALEANGGNATKTARETGIPTNTIRSWRDGVGTPPAVTQIRDEKRPEFSERLKMLAGKLIDVAFDKLNEPDGVPLNHLMTGIGIAIEKWQLLEGNATDRTEILDTLSDDERAARIAALLDKARARRAGRAAPDEE